MMTTLLRSQTFAVAPNSRLNTPMVPGPHTSWVISTSTFTHTLSPGWTDFLPEARAMSFSVSVIGWRIPEPNGACNIDSANVVGYIEVVSETWAFLATPAASAAYNMAVDEALLRGAAARQRPLLRIYSWRKPSVSI